MACFLSKVEIPPKNLGIALTKKAAVALRVFAYGIAGDLGDDHLVMGLSQAINCAKCFVIEL
jgi:hypothetical protein